MYNRFESGVHPREPIMDILSATKDHSSSLEDHVALLQKRILLLKELLGQVDTPSKDVDSVLNDSEVTDNECNDNNVLIKTIAADNRYSCASNISDTESGFVDGNELVSPSKNTSVITADQLAEELSCVALDWKTIRHVRECVCSTPFDHFSRKYNCWKCGNVFCTRCIDKHTSLPGHLSRRSVPVCRPCYKDICRSLSVDSP
uniref:FYVE-type domain-containing protein n=1 Tax=Strigamia maritima TaxID=126957 RepID=T1JK61_STRMM